jgi:hypothetical protein
MPLSRLREPFDDPEWIFELKYDGFRGLAYVNGGGAELFSRRQLRYRQFADLCSEISLDLNASTLFESFDSATETKSEGKAPQPKAEAKVKAVMDALARAVCIATDDPRLAK